MADSQYDCLQGRHGFCEYDECDCDCHDVPNLLAGKSVLREADEIINGQRRKDYGGPLESFARIGRLWAPVLGLDEVTPEQVALCMVGLKVARAMQGFHRDSLVDIAGYAGCIELIQQERDADSG